LSELVEEREAPVEELARRSGRGLRSAIGLHGFARGGFLVDGGRADESCSPKTSRLGTLVGRYDVPSDWRLILALPERSQGLSGIDEQRAFAAQRPMPVELTGELCRITLMDWLPSLLEADFARFSRSTYEFGVRVGEFFSAAQGGVFAHPRMAAMVEWLRLKGVEGVAQTSWGPTLAILCLNQHEAQMIVNDLAQTGDWPDTSLRVVEPLNRGASVHRE
jgi:beta-ribofuranosylaminobenzene 5'-phosphate synthase